MTDGMTITDGQEREHSAPLCSVSSFTLRLGARFPAVRRVHRLVQSIRSADSRQRNSPTARRVTVIGMTRPLAGGMLDSLSLRDTH